MLLLVCDACAAATAASSADSQLQPDLEAADGDGSDLPQPHEQQREQDQQQDGQGLVCELCQRRKEQGTGMAPAGGRRLRILCLHGFRQSAKNFEVSRWLLVAAGASLAVLKEAPAPCYLVG